LFFITISGFISTSKSFIGLKRGGFIKASFLLSSDCGRGSSIGFAISFSDISVLGREACLFSIGFFSF